MFIPESGVCMLDSHNTTNKQNNIRLRHIQPRPLRVCRAAARALGRDAATRDGCALVGDAADGYPGLPGWGAKSTAAVLARYPHLEDIPDSVAAWDLKVRGAASLARRA